MSQVYQYQKNVISISFRSRDLKISFGNRVEEDLKILIIQEHME